MDICINGTLINEVVKTKFLGIIVDNTLSWKYQIDHVCNKISKSFYLIAKARKVLDTNSLIQLYYSFVYSYIQYGTIVWGTANANILNKVIVLQKKIIRMICGLRRREHTSPLFKKHKILKLEDIYKFKICSTVFKITIGDLPNLSWTNLYKGTDVHSYNTRNKSDFRVTCKIKTNYSKSTFQYASANLWKTLPTDVKIAKTYFTYKKLFKDYCTGKYNL